MTQPNEHPLILLYNPTAAHPGYQRLPHSLLQLGALLEVGRFDLGGAAALYARAADIEPEVSVLLVLAALEERLGRSARAAHALERALTLGDAPGGWLRLGWLRIRAGQVRDAVQVLVQASATSREPRVAEWLGALGFVPGAHAWHKISQTTGAGTRKPSFWHTYGRSESIFRRKFRRHRWLTGWTHALFVIARFVAEGNPYGVRPYLEGWRKGARDPIQPPPGLDDPRARIGTILRKG